MILEPMGPRGRNETDNRKARRCGTLPVTDFLASIDPHRNRDSQIKIPDTPFSVRVSTTKTRVFAASPVCFQCGLVPSIAAIEQDTGKVFSVNLYGESNGREVLFTVDHILPVALGGIQAPWNLRTACTTCNVARGTHMDSGPYSPNAEFITEYELFLRGYVVMEDKVYQSLLPHLSPADSDVLRDTIKSLHTHTENLDALHTLIQPRHRS